MIKSNLNSIGVSPGSRLARGHENVAVASSAHNNDPRIDALSTRGRQVSITGLIRQQFVDAHRFVSHLGGFFTKKDQSDQSSVDLPLVGLQQSSDLEDFHSSLSQDPTYAKKASKSQSLLHFFRKFTSSFKPSRLVDTMNRFPPTSAASWNDRLMAHHANIALSDDFLTHNSAVEKFDQQLNPKELNVKPLVGHDGHLYFISSDNKLFRFDPDTNEILKTGLEGVQDVFLGANQKTYAVKHDRFLELTKKGTLAPGTVPIMLEPSHYENGVKQIAVSHLANFSLVLNNDLELFSMDHANKVSYGLELPNMHEIPKSIAIQKNGDVLMLSDQNTLWKGQLNDNKDRIQWVEVGEFETSTLGLKTLPNKEVAVLFSDESIRSLGQTLDTGIDLNQLPLIQENAVYQNQFERFHQSLKRTSKYHVSTFGAMVGSSSSIDLNAVKKPFKSMAQAIKDIPAKLKDPFQFENKKHKGNTFAQYQAQMSMYNNQLLNVTHYLSSANAGLKKEMESLDTQAITNRSTAFINEVMQSEPEYQQKINELNKRKNALQRLRNIRGQSTLKQEKEDSDISQLLISIMSVRANLLGKNDPVSEQLRSIIKSPALFAKAKDMFKHGQADVLIADHALLGTFAHTFQYDAPKSSEEKAKVIEKLASYWNDSLPHLILKSGIHKTDPFANAATGFDKMQSVFKRQNDLVARMVSKHATALGETMPSKPTIGDTSSMFIKLVDSMKEGDSINIGKEKDRGFNTDTLRLVASGAFASLTAGISSLVSWVIPIIDRGEVSAMGLSITKQKDGILLNIEKSKSKYHQEGFRTGVGLAHLPNFLGKLGIHWAFAGAEIALKYKSGQTDQDSISLSIPDRGNLGDVLRKVFSGESDLYDLLRQSSATISTKQHDKMNNLELSGVLVGATGTENPSWDKITGVSGPGFDHIQNDASALGAVNTVGKLLTAGVLEGAVNFGSKQSKVLSNSSTGVQGEQSRNKQFGLNNARASLIGVNVLESDFFKFLFPGDITSGEEVGNANLLGRIGIPTLLPGAALNRTFAGLGHSTYSSGMVYDKQGSPKNLTLTVSVENSAKLMQALTQNDKELQKVPGLIDAVKAIKAKNTNNDAMNVFFKLKPELLQSLPEDLTERKQKLTELGQDIRNFKISKMSIHNTNSDIENAALLVPGMTHNVTGRVSTTTANSGEVAFVYTKLKVKRHVNALIDKISQYDDSAWGTHKRQEHLSELLGRIEKAIDGFAFEHEQQFKFGASLKQAYEKSILDHKYPVMQALHRSLHDTIDAQKVTKLKQLFSEFQENVEATRQSFQLKPFSGPVVIPQGDLFESKKSIYDNNLGVSEALNVNLEDIVHQIQSVLSVNLTAHPVAKIPKIKRESIQKMDVLKQSLSRVTNVNVSAKKEFIAWLESSMIRPQHSQDKEKVNEYLTNMGLRS